MANILQDFWFSEIKRYVRQHIRMCFECLLTKNPRGKRPGLLHPIPLGRRPFETVHIDHVGPFITTRNGNKHILVLVNNFTKFVILFVVKDTTSESFLECTRLFVSVYGLPARVISDQGTCYTSRTFGKFCMDEGIRLVLTSSRHPQANGQVERVHSVVMATLMTQNNRSDEWDVGLPEVQRIIHNSESKVTTRTSFEFLHGYRPRFRLGALRDLSKTSNDWTTLAEIRDTARVQLELSKQKMKTAYDEHRHDNLHYNVGEIVVMRRAPVSTGQSTKLQDRYRGPLVVTEVLPGDVYRVTELSNEKKSRFATTAYLAQLKSWKLFSEGDEETGIEEDGQGNENETEEHIEEVRKSMRERRAPNWTTDYSME